MAEYEVWLGDPLGRRLALIDHISSMTATRVANNIGSCVLVLPDIYDDYVKLDGIIEVWRAPAGGALSLFNAYMTRTLDYIDEDGRDVTAIGGVDGKDLLRRRIVAYSAGSTDAELTDNADDIAKIVVRFACTTAATDTDRDWSGNFFTVDPDSSTAQSITKSYAYRNVLELCQDLSEASRTAGTRMYFDVTPYSTTDNTMGWNFSTTINQPGVDHAGTDMVIFGPAWGNMEGAHIRFDHSEEVTVCYSGGQGLESARIVEVVSDTAREEASPWNRCELFYNCSGQASDTAQVYSEGQSKLAEYRPRLSFTGRLKDGPSTHMGIDWNFGDKVVVEYRGYQYDAIVTSVTLSLDGSGNEVIEGTFELLSGGGSLAGMTST